MRRPYRLIISIMYSIKMNSTPTQIKNEFLQEENLLAAN
jgi:hypothetical protein